MNDTNEQDPVFDSTDQYYVCEALPGRAERYAAASAAAERISRSLNGRRLSASLWRARCPYHKGPHRRVYIAAATDGSVAVVCETCGDLRGKVNEELSNRERAERSAEVAR